MERLKVNQLDQSDGPQSTQSNKKKKPLGPIQFQTNPNMDASQLSLGNTLVLSDKGLSKGKEEEIVITSFKEDLEILEELGRGTSGVVCKTKHKPTGKVLAVKEIACSFDEASKKLLKTELDTLISCDSPYIVRCYNAFYNKGTIHIALEYMDRGTLASILKEIGKIPEIILAIIAFQVLKGLEYLHKTMKIIHRDIKPSNLLVNSEGLVKIADFGVSGKLENTLEYKNTWVGTSIYMSPERLKGDQYLNDTDLWSLGLSLIECAIGKFPYEITKKTKLWDMITILNEKPAPKLPAEFSPEFKDFVSICLQKEAGKRSSAGELLNHKFVSKFHDGKGISQFKGWLQFVYKQ